MSFSPVRSQLNSGWVEWVSLAFEFQGANGDVLFHLHGKKVGVLEVLEVLDPPVAFILCWIQGRSLLVAVVDEHEHEVEAGSAGNPGEFVAFIFGERQFSAYGPHT